jgi:endonuclease/exonuclease/phosphatase family metal-dependent hydrolase
MSVLAGFVGVVCWVVAVVTAGFTVVRLLGAERGTPAVQLIAYTPYAAVGSLAAGGLAAAAGGWVPAMVLLGCGVVLVALVVPRLVPSAVPGGHLDGGVRLRVMTANVLYDRGDTAALVEQAKVDDIDVLAVQELTHGALAAMDRAGVDGLLPFRVAYPAVRGTGSAVFSRHPIAPGPAPGTEVRRHRCGLLQPSATILVPGAGPVLVESVHPCSPAPGKTGCWARDLAAQPPAEPDGVPRVLMGDFNASLDHGLLRRLLRTGYRDAAAERGRGLLPTWPYRNAPVPFRVPPVTLDHVLVDRRIGVLEVGTRTVPESDHRAVLAELVIPAPR